MMEAAWWVGFTGKLDAKKYPKQAALLWDRNADVQDVDHMFAIAKSMAGGRIRREPKTKA